MAILSKTATLYPSGKSIKRYRELGYDAQWHKELAVNVSDLSDYSNVIVDVQCDNPNCRKIQQIHYSKYTKNILQNNGKYYCNACWSERFQKIIYDQFGVTNVSQLQDIKQKKEETMMKHYNVKHPFQSKELYEHMLDVIEGKHGTRNIGLVDEFKEKRAQTNLERYGCINPLQSEEIKAKHRRTCKEKYGVEYISQVQEIREKVARSMYCNSTVSSSKQQRAIYQVLKSRYPQAQSNYPVGRAYNCDIIVDNIDFEVDYGGHNLCVKLGKITQKEFDQRQMIRDKIIKSNGYKVVRLISNKERKIPSDQVLLGIFELSKKYFEQYPYHTWCDWYIEQGIYRNAEHKDGVSFDFGELHTVTKSDLSNNAQVA